MDQRTGAHGCDGGSLRALRITSGLTLSQAAERLGYSVSHLSNVERGVRRASAVLLRAYSGLDDDGPRVLMPPADHESGGRTRDAEDDFGLRLMRMRLARGWSLAALSQRTAVSRSYLGNLEQGRRSTPSLEVARSCDKALAAGGALEALAESARLPGPAAPQDRRKTWHDEAWTRDPQRALTDGHARLMTLRNLAQYQAAHRVLPELDARARLLESSAAATRDGAHSAELWLLAARYAEFAGWMAQEDGNESGAAQWTETAARWAARNRDIDMAAYRWERHALVTLYRRDGPGTIALARRAATQRGASPRVLALALRREAQGHALAGDSSQFRRSLAAASQLIRGAPPPYPHGTSWGPNSIEDSSCVIEASSLADLGLHRAAVRLFGPEPGSAVPASAVRTKLRFTVRGALAYAEAGAVEHACSLLENELAALERIDSATIRTDLERLAAALNRHRALPAVVGLLPDLHHIIRQRNRLM